MCCLPCPRPTLDPNGALAYLGLMAIHPILTAPDPRLKEVSRDVERVDVEIRMLIDDMFDSMYAAKGIGLAAIQIGVPKRVIVMDLAQNDGRDRALRLHQSQDPVDLGRYGHGSRKAASPCPTSGRMWSARRASGPSISTATAS